MYKLIVLHYNTWVQLQIRTNNVGACDERGRDREGCNGMCDLDSGRGHAGTGDICREDIHNNQACMLQNDFFG